MNAGDRIDDYVLDRLLGRGGMGEVWRARDTALDRWVALKVLSKADPAELDRLRREARAAAALAHPGIVRIYAVGDRYIAMELIEGATLADAHLDARAAATAMRDAARAIAVAHAGGIIHRDLKPQNLMLDGAGRVHVMDFGLARRVEGGESLTQTGVTLGTPAYMSPEQARGERAEVRSDVYGLGATLHHLLSGKPPFDGATVVAVLKGVLEREPQSIGASPGLEAIVMKCLAKSPSARYAGAAELADDLDRWLGAQPVLAKPVTILTRVGHAVSRRRAAFWTAVAAVGIAAAAAGLLIVRVRGAERDAAEEKRRLIEEMRTTSATCLEAALQLRRLGNVPAMESQALRLNEVCGRVSAALPGVAEPHVRLGRMRRAQMRFGLALEQQELALSREPGLAEARMERGRLLVRRYFVAAGARRAAWRRARAFDPRVTEPDIDDREDAEMRAWKKQALADFASVGDAEASAYALLLARDGAAVAWFERAAGEPGADEEVFEVLGRIAVDRRHFAKAVEWFTRGHKRDLGYAPHLAGRGFARLRIAMADIPLGRDPTGLLQDAVRDYDEIERLGQLDSTARHGRADVWLTLAHWKAGRGGQAEGELRRAEQDLEAIEALADASVPLNRGVIDLERARIAQTKGDDPAPYYRAAASRLEQATKRHGDEFNLWANLAYVHGNWGQYEAGCGRDPTAHYQAALEALEHAVRLAPTMENYRARGKLHYNVGVQKADDRRDSTADFAAALADLEQALKLARDRDADTLILMGNVRTRQAMLGGRGAADLFRQAFRDYDQAVNADPVSEMALVRRAGARAALAQVDDGADVATVLREALLDAKRACELGPANGEAWQMRGKILYVLATTIAERGRPAAAEHAEARRAMEEAVRLQASSKRELGPLIEKCAEYAASGKP